MVEMYLNTEMAKHNCLRCTYLESISVAVEGYLLLSAQQTHSLIRAGIIRIVCDSDKSHR